MLQRAGILALACLVACSEPATPVNEGEVPARIVSLDVCADQFVLKFAPRESILALSPDAAKDFSYMAEAAIGLPVVRPVAEDVIALRPDLIVRSYGGGPNAAAFFDRAGIPVIEIGWAGDLDAVMAETERVAAELGAEEEGRRVTAEARARLSRIATRDGETALYVTPSGVTTGPGSLIHELLLAAGLSNFETTSGWRSIPLERLAYASPDVIAGAFFGSSIASFDAWSATKHPVARARMSQRETIALNGAWTACGGWYVVDAVEALSQSVRP